MHSIDGVSMRCICGCPRVHVQRLLAPDEAHFLLWLLDCCVCMDATLLHFCLILCKPYGLHPARLLCPWDSAIFLFHFIVKFRDCVKADGAWRWIVYCPWLQEAEILCNLPCNISEATVKLQLYIIDINLSWWMHSFLAASRALIINFIFIIKGFL